MNSITFFQRPRADGWLVMVGVKGEATCLYADVFLWADSWDATGK